jgi:hypothetical protein
VYAIPLEFVAQWQQVNNKWMPHSVDIHCPFCARHVTFTLRDYALDGNRNTMAASATCPGCHQTARFWAIDPRPFSDTQGKECQELCIFPKPTLSRNPIAGIDKMPPEIGKAYASTVNVYNAREWTATAVCCRRVLEGIAKNFLPPAMQNKPLAQQLSDLKANVDLAKPLTALAEALRKGGHLGAHFDLERAPDQAAASQMVDLLEYLIQYLYVLPAEVESLHDTVTR